MNEFRYNEKTEFASLTNLELSKLYDTRLAVYTYVREISGGKIRTDLLKEVNDYVFLGIIPEKK